MEILTEIWGLISSLFSSVSLWVREIIFFIIIGALIYFTFIIAKFFSNLPSQIQNASEEAKKISNSFLDNNYNSLLLRKLDTAFFYCRCMKIWPEVHKNNNLVKAKENDEQEKQSEEYDKLKNTPLDIVQKIKIYDWNHSQCIYGNELKFIINFFESQYNKEISLDITDQENTLYDLFEVVEESVVEFYTSFYDYDDWFKEWKNSKESKIGLSFASENKNNPINIAKKDLLNSISRLESKISLMIFNLKEYHKIIY